MVNDPIVGAGEDGVTAGVEIDGLLLPRLEMWTWSRKDQEGDVFREEEVD